MLYAEPLVCFGKWQYRQSSGTLAALHSTDHGLVLEPRVHALLNYFLLHPADILSKDHLLDTIWGSTEGTEAALMRAIGTLRKILGEDSKQPQFIETVPKRGYRWIAQIQLLPQSTPASDSNAQSQPVIQSDLMTSSHWPINQALSQQLQQQAQQQADQLVLRTIDQHTQQRMQMLRYLAASLCLVLTVSLLFSLLLWRMGEAAYIPAFSRVVTLSAMTGQEQNPLLSQDQQQLYYLHQSLADPAWRFILHDLKSHRKQQSAFNASLIGQPQWLQQWLLFQSDSTEGCQIQRLAANDLAGQPEVLHPCHQVVEHGLAVDGATWFWLDIAEDTGATELWQWQQPQPRLVSRFSPAYRKPVQLLLQQQHALVLLEQDFNTSILFRVNLADGSQQKMAEFPFVFNHFAWWDSTQLLLTAEDSIFLFSLSNQKLIKLVTAAGHFADVAHQQQKLLATSFQDPAHDLYLYQPDSGLLAGKSQLASWLNSNKNDRLLAADNGQIAIVSERSGLPQVWWVQNNQLQQLTRFKQQQQISQLIWHQHRLFAVIDQQWVELDLTSDGAADNLGDIKAGPISGVGSKRLISCDNRWFWTEYAAGEWQLQQFNSLQQSEKLLTNVVDLRCGAAGNLVLQLADIPYLQSYDLNSRQLTPLPIKLNWRAHSEVSWTSTNQGLYWLSENPKQLMYWDWQSATATTAVWPELQQAAGLYSDYSANQVYFLMRRSAETDVVWLTPHQSAD